MNKTNKKIGDIDQYIKTFPKYTQVILKKLRTVIKKVVPKAGEKISYDIPTFTLNGKSFIAFAGWKNHVSIYPASGASKKLAKYRTGKGTLSFPLDKPLPLGLIVQYVKYRAKNTVPKGKLTTCSRGHKFYKSKDVPVCPTCWPGRYKKK